MHFTLPKYLCRELLMSGETMTDQEYAEKSDKELLALVAADDEQAFSALFNRYWKNLFSFVYRLTREENDTKDILQDVFIYIWKNRQSLYSGDSFLPYLNTVARSNVIMAFRRDKVRLQGMNVLLENITRSAQSDDQLLLKDARQTLDGELAKMPSNKAQVRAMEKKPAVNWLVIVVAVNIGLAIGYLLKGR